MQWSSRYSLVPSLSLLASIVVIEILGGLHASSLALLANAIGVLVYGLERMLLWFAKPRALPTPPAILARLTCAVTGACVLCLLASVFVVYEAHRRAVNRPEIDGTVVLVVAVTSMIGTLVSEALLPAEFGAINTAKGIPANTSKVLFGPLQLVVTAIIVMAADWHAIDPIIAAAIAFYVILRAAALANQAGRGCVRHWT